MQEQKHQQLVAYARQHRHSPTETEAVLWRELRGGKLGVVFRRQVVVGGYIADFASVAARVVVQVDGGWHRGRERRDARRDAWMRKEGWLVVRVTTHAVMRDLAAVAVVVRAALAR